MMKLDAGSYEKIFDNLYDGLYFVDTNRIITFWSKSAERITGYRADEVVGRSCADNILMHIDAAGRRLCLGCCPLSETIKDRNSREANVFLHHKDGHRIPVAVRISPLIDESGEMLGAIELFTDLSSRASTELRMQELEQLALIDPLTKLANRAYIERELAARIEERRRLGLPFGLLFMDIDHFKLINDTYGHQTGDEVLKFVSATFIANSRPFDLYGRWAGDEFIAVIRNVEMEELQDIADRLRLLISNSFMRERNDTINVTISVGATMLSDADTPESLLYRADRLLYESKHEGRNRVTAH